jgi:peptidoglycan/LPS O-acetylase OafA/YrhL
VPPNTAYSKLKAERLRLTFIDGLRGIAIISVILFHSYVRWPNLVPYGDRFIHLPVVSYGWLGVELFFLISGFVIFMTLEKSLSFRDFLSRRWLRLFPAMLICSIAVFASAALFPERPSGLPAFRDILPGLTFMEPLWWEFLLGSAQGVIEGTFWSIFVEVKFYFVAGLLFFSVGGRKMIAILFALFLAAAAISKGRHYFPPAMFHWPYLLVQISSAGQFGWFAAGALYYRYFHEGKPLLLAAAVAVALAASAATGELTWQDKLATVSVVIAFTAAVSMPLIQLMLSRRFLIFLGFISYPLYLLHENMMVSMIVKVGHAAPWVPAIAVPIMPILVVIGLGSLVAFYVEPWVREALRPVYCKARFFMGIEAAA